MLCRPVLRLMLTLLLAAGLVLGGASFGTSPGPAAAAPNPVDCPHHASLASEHGADHSDAGHDHGSKKGGCHCPLMTCSSWTLAPVALALLPFDPTAVPHRPTATAAFIPHPPGVPLHPPRT